MANGQLLSVLLRADVTMCLDQFCTKCRTATRHLNHVLRQPGNSWRRLFLFPRSSRMRVMNHNWSARKQRLHLQSVGGINRHSALSEDRISLCNFVTIFNFICTVKLYRKIYSCNHETFRKTGIGPRIMIKFTR